MEYINTELNKNEKLELFDQDIASHTLINSGGSHIVNSGGFTREVEITSGGKVYIRKDGLSEEIDVGNGGRLDVWGTAEKVTVGSGAVVNVSSGGRVGNGVIESKGSTNVLDKGRVESIRVQRNGTLRLYGASIGVDITIENGGAFNASTNATVFNGVNALGSFSIVDHVARNLLLTNVGRLDVNAGGAAYDTVLSSDGGQICVSSGGSSYRTRCNDGGKEFILDGGIAYDSVLLLAGKQYITGGVASRTNLGCYASQTISDGGVAYDTGMESYARQFILAGGSAVRTELNNYGSQFVSSGGVAISTFIQSGGSQMVLDGAVARDTNVAYGSQILSSGGTASGTLIGLGGKQYLRGGSAHNVQVKRYGTVYVEEASCVTGDLVIGGGIVLQAQLDASRANVIFDLSERQDFDAVLIDDMAQIKGGNFFVTVRADPLEGEYRLAAGAGQFHGTITVKNTSGQTLGTLGDRESIVSGGVQYRLDNTDGVLTLVISNPQYQPLTLPKNLDWSGDRCTVKFRECPEAAYYSILVTDGGGALVSYLSHLEGTSADFELVYGNDYSVRVAAYDGNGVPLAVSNRDYRYVAPPEVKADREQLTNQSVSLAAGFDRRCVLREYSLDNIHWQRYEGAVEVETNGTVFFRGADSSGNISQVTAFEVDNIDRIAPEISNIHSDVTAPTNAGVTVYADADDDRRLQDFVYRLEGEKTWRSVSSGVKVEENTTVYFRAVDAAGNEATAQYVVSNIDKIAPDAPVLSLSPAIRTHGSVTVTATFAADVTTKEYSFDGKTWFTYTQPVSVDANVTFLARGYDAAGNVSQARYEIKNIVTLDPKGPGAVTIATKVSKYNATVSWKAPAAQDKAKITGYEVEYNGKISIVKGTNLTFKNLAVGTGYTVQVRAIDSLGRYSALSPVTTFDIRDVTAPTLGKVTAAISGYTGTIAWSGADNVGIVKYVVNCAGQTQTVTSGAGVKFDHLAVGKYNATVQAFDAAGNASKIGKVGITVKDATPPDQVMGLVKPQIDTKYSALLQWNEGIDNSNKVTGYEIQLDGGKIWKSAKNSLKVSKLTVGEHSYQVRALDKEKNEGAWSEVQTFTVKDMTAPTSVKAKATVNGYSVSFALEGKDNSGKIAKYVVTCGDLSVTTTSSTAVLDGFGVGKQTALVVAYDAEGNASMAGKVSFTVKDVTKPDPVNGLTIPFVDTRYRAMLSWNPGKDNSNVIAAYEIKLDNGKVFKTNKTSLTVSNLSVGDHTYQVRALDKDKNIGEWSDAKSFTVKDMTAPSAVSVKAKVEGNALTLSWSTPKDNIGVTGYILKHGVNLENTVNLAADKSSFRIDRIAKGNYQYQLVAIDAAGNQSQAKTGKATIKTELAVALNLALPDAIPSLAFASAATTEMQSSILQLDQTLPEVGALTAYEPLLADSALDSLSGSEKKQSPLFAVGF